VLAFFNTTYHDFLRCIVNIFRLEIGASFFNTTYHDFLRSILNIFRLEIGASFFYTTYHDFLRSILNIFRLEIGASFFLIPRTTISALHHHSFAPHIHNLPAIPSHIPPSHPPISPPSLTTEISLSPMTFSSPPSWPPFAVRFLRSLLFLYILVPKTRDGNATGS